MLIFLLSCVADATSETNATEPAEPIAPVTILAAFPPPDGSVRVPPPDAFGEWIQAIPLRDIRAPLRAYDGRLIHGHDAWVLELDMVDGDLQQCADALLRVRGEWQRSVGEPVSFFATSGDPIPWSRYAAGEDPYADGNRIRWKPGSDRTWDGYLRNVFDWAGTISLRAYETTSVERGPAPGDILVRSGSPGHAVLLMDVAVRGEDTFILFAESYMPAQDFHIERGPVDGWWRWDTENEMDLRTWVFAAADLRAWK
jgi:hypothetical protein